MVITPLGACGRLGVAGCRAEQPGAGPPDARAHTAGARAAGGRRPGRGPGGEREEMKEIAQDEIDEVTSVCTVRTDTVAACDHATVWFLIIQFSSDIDWLPRLSVDFYPIAAKQSVR